MSSSGLNTKLPSGTFTIKGACVVIVKTEWNSDIVDALEAGCREHLTHDGLSNILTITVPGVVEIPFAIRQCWDKLKYRDLRPHAFIALGAVIKGDTPHFDYVNKILADGITQLNLTLPVPTIFGVLTVNNEEQAKERIGGKHGHKGMEAADAAIKMMSISLQIDQAIQKA
jgi:6,7-dimethyl-8-ribityllumazine synthase